MRKRMECPSCEADISGSYEPSDPDVGIPCGGWFCDECDLFIEDENESDR